MAHMGHSSSFIYQPTQVVKAITARPLLLQQFASRREAERDIHLSIHARNLAHTAQSLQQVVTPILLFLA